tara:strand:- start:39 stop:398 length:360 start_codon:yes stop_codon:yes gene_type:complete
MLSNHKLETLNKERNYLLTSLSREGKFLSTTGMKFLNKELSKVNAKIQEASKREYVGTIENGSLVYIADSEWKTVCEKCIYIEGLGSGWDASTFDMTSGSQTKVVIDGGQDWTEVITFN